MNIIKTISGLFYLVFFLLIIVLFGGFISKFFDSIIESTKIYNALLIIFFFSMMMMIKENFRSEIRKLENRISLLEEQAAENAASRNEQNPSW
jgi:hypothetical protein